MRLFGKWSGFGQKGECAHLRAVFRREWLAFLGHVRQIGSKPDHLYEVRVLCDGEIRWDG